VTVGEAIAESFSSGLCIRMHKASDNSEDLKDVLRRLFLRYVDPCLPEQIRMT
jgi:hypothetical protein